MNNKKGIISFLIIFVFALVIFAIFGGLSGMKFSGLLAATTPVTLPECNFGGATKGDSFVLEDFARSDLTKEDFRTPPPSGWIMVNSHSLAFDGQPSKVDCGRGCSYLVTAGKANSLNRVGSYVPYAGGQRWEMYETKLNLKQQPMQIDLKNVHFDKSGMGTLVDRWYLFDGNKKKYLFAWGDGGDVADVGAGLRTYNADVVRFCVDNKHARAYSLAIKDGYIYSKNIDLTDIKDSAVWYLGIEGNNGGDAVYLAAVGSSYNESISNIADDTPNTLSVSGVEYKGLAETNSNMYVDDIVILPFTSPIEVPLPATQPDIEQVSVPGKVPVNASIGFFAEVTTFIKWLFSPLTNLIG